MLREFSRYAMENYNLEKDIASDLKEQFELEQKTPANLQTVVCFRSGGVPFCSMFRGVPK